MKLDLPAEVPDEYSQPGEQDRLSIRDHLGRREGLELDQELSHARGNGARSVCHKAHH
jgi:hypothetical protein